MFARKGRLPCRNRGRRQGIVQVAGARLGSFLSSPLCALALLGKTSCARVVKVHWSLNPIDFIAALILLAGLLVNINPLIPIVGMAVSVLRGTSTRLLQGLGFKKIEWAVVLCLAYWLASYFWSTGDFGNLISYEFLRNDGAMLISYTAFIFFLGWPLKVRHLRA